MLQACFVVVRGPAKICCFIMYNMIVEDDGEGAVGGLKFEIPGLEFKNTSDRIQLAIQSPAMFEEFLFLFAVNV